VRGADCLTPKRQAQGRNAATQRRTHNGHYPPPTADPTLLSAAARRGSDDSEVTISPSPSAGPGERSTLDESPTWSTPVHRVGGSSRNGLDPAWWARAVSAARGGTARTPQQNLSRHADQDLFGA
jgi:hypothetical protein